LSFVDFTWWQDSLSCLGRGCGYEKHWLANWQVVQWHMLSRETTRLKYQQTNKTGECYSLKSKYVSSWVLGRDRHQQTQNTPVTCWCGCDTRSVPTIERLDLLAMIVSVTRFTVCTYHDHCSRRRVSEKNEGENCLARLHDILAVTHISTQCLDYFLLHEIWNLNQEHTVVTVCRWRRIGSGKKKLDWKHITRQSTYPGKAWIFFFAFGMWLYSHPFHKM
jgi:hypothetical protein